jgi:hypothetical protein
MMVFANISALIKIALSCLIIGFLLGLYATTPSRAPDPATVEPTPSISTR